MPHKSAKKAYPAKPGHPGKMPPKDMPMKEHMMPGMPPKKMMPPGKKASKKK